MSDMIPTITTERVAASGGTRQALALSVDDVTRDYSGLEYSAMRRDAVIASVLNLYRAAVVSDDPQLVPAVTNSDADGYELSSEITNWVSSQLEDLDSPLIDSLGTIIEESMAYGCKISEVVLRQDRAYTGRTQVVLHAIKPKPRHAAALGIDAYGNVQSIWANVMDGTAMRRQELPVSDFLVYSFRPADGDARGTSILRPAYVPWDLKMKTWPEYYKYLVQFASPSIWGTTSPEAGPEDLGGVQVDAVTALLSKLLQFQNGSAFAGRHGTVLEAIGSEGEGAAFLSAFELYNREMVTAMLTAARATMEAKHGSRADSETASDVVGTFIRQTRLSLERAVRRAALMRVVRLNYGEQAVRLTPYLSLGGVAQEDVMALMTSVANLARARYLDPSQLPELDARLGLATRTADEVTARTIQPPTPMPLEGVPDDNPTNNRTS